MPDKFSKFSTSLESPARNGISVTPGSSNLATFSRMLYVGGNANSQLNGVAGDVCLETIDGTVLTFVNVPIGSILPIRTAKVFANSTASNIIALF